MIVSVQVWYSTDHLSTTAKFQFDITAAARTLAAAVAASCDSCAAAAIPFAHVAVVIEAVAAVVVNVSAVVLVLVVVPTFAAAAATLSFVQSGDLLRLSVAPQLLSVLLSPSPSQKAVCSQ